MGCGGNTANLKFNDEYSLGIRILDIKSLQSQTEKEMSNLDSIMEIQFDFYLTKNLRIYKKLKSNYKKMKNSYGMMDSISQLIMPLYDSMKESLEDSLKSIPKDTIISYELIFKSNFKKFIKHQKKYFKSLRKIKKIFKKDKKRLIYINDYFDVYRNTYYDIKYQRESLQPTLNRFYKKFSQTLFQSKDSSEVKNIRFISEKLAIYILKLDKYENFLLNIDNISFQEKGSYVVVIPKKKSMKFMRRYEKGLKEYPVIIKNIRKMVEGI